jgi:predicted nucleic-acid-binding protein
MRAIDTNVLVRLIIRDDPRQTSSADSFVENGAWVSLLALAEAISVLDSVYQLNPSQLATTVEMLLNHQSLTIQDQDVAASALALFRSKPAIGFSDCLLLEIARQAGHLPFGTFDRPLSRLPGTEKL